MCVCSVSGPNVQLGRIRARETSIANLRRLEFKPDRDHHGRLLQILQVYPMVRLGRSLPLHGAVTAVFKPKGTSFYHCH